MDSGSCELIWHGHSCVEVVVPGTRIWFDPFFSGNPLAPDWRTLPAPDLLLVTHDHGDHLGDGVDIARETEALCMGVVDMAGLFAENGVPAGRIFGMNFGGSADYCGVTVSLVPAQHTSGRGAPCGFVLRLPGGPVMYFAGDTAYFSDMKLIGELYAPDWAFLPFDGRYNMGPDAAALAARAVGARFVVPIHYGVLPGLPERPDAFVEKLAELYPRAEAVCLRPGEPFVIGG